MSAVTATPADSSTMSKPRPASALASSYDCTAEVAPASRAIADFSSLRSMVTIWPAPASFAHWTANSPIGPAPTTRTRCPVRSPVFHKACSAMAAGSSMAAARGSMPSGILSRLPTGETTYCAYAPSLRLPK